MGLNDNQWSYGSHSHSITTTPTITTHWVHNIDPDFTKQEKKPMSTADKVAEERREKRERARIEALWDGYDTNDFSSLNDGTVIAFEWSPRDSDKVYNYAAILAGNKWHATGDLAPRNADVDTFIAWLIDKGVAIGDIEFLREV